MLFDSNVLISAFIAQGVAQRGFRLALELHDTVESSYILDEVAANLSRKFQYDEEDTHEVRLFLTRVCEIYDPEGPARIKTRDPKDDPVLQAAIASNTDILVTGDKDLLTQADTGGVRIMTPRDFVALHAAG